MEELRHNFKTFAWRITASHTVAYFVAGLFALFVIRYDLLFGTGAFSHMRPTNSAWVAAGAGLQILRGFLLSLFLFPFMSIFLETKRGWLKFWFLSFGLSYFLTFSANTGSFEGFIYTNTELKFHLLGIPEAIIYLTLFTLFMWGWYKKPRKIFNIISIVLVLGVAFMSLMGVLASLGIVATP